MERKPIGLSTPYRKVKKDKDGWVGLTDKQIWQLATECTIGGDLHADKFARAIEVKLKEKNS